MQIAEKAREAKGKGQKERYTRLNAEFQRIARRDKKAVLSDQCKEIEEKNRMEKTSDLLKKIRDLSPVLLENGKECDIPTSALYIRNVNGPKDENGLVRGFFPVARGLKTDRYSFEISIKRDNTLAGVIIYDDLKDPYQLENIDYKKEPELFKELCIQLAAKLEEANDVWHKEGILEKLAL